MSAKEGLEFIKKLDEYGEVKGRMIVKAEDETDPKYGYIPYKRPIDMYIKYGVINLDKPPGPTSHEVVAWVKKLLGLRKAGHGGTLDPKVTGVLPVALENVTKVIGNVVHSGKEYICVMQLHSPVPEEKLRKVLKEFTGQIYQRPPLRSSVKRTLRIRTIHYVELLEYNGKYALLRIGCEAGTYIRKYCHDIGEVLGVGAHMKELRRTRTGPFKEDETLVTMQELSEAVYVYKEEKREDLLRKVILPGEYAISHLPKIVIRDSAVDAIAHGADLAVPGILLLHENIRRNDLVAVMTLKGELVALGRAQMSTEEIIQAKKGIAVKTIRVIMPTGMYPKLWKRKEEKINDPLLR